MNEGDMWEMAGGGDTDEKKDWKDNEAVKKPDKQREGK